MGSTDSGRPSIVTAVPFRIRLANTSAPTGRSIQQGEPPNDNLLSSELPWIMAVNRPSITPFLLEELLQCGGLVETCWNPMKQTSGFAPLDFRWGAKLVPTATLSRCGEICAWHGLVMSADECWCLTVATDLMPGGYQHAQLIKLHTAMKLDCDLITIRTKYYTFRPVIVPWTPYFFRLLDNPRRTETKIAPSFVKSFTLFHGQIWLANCTHTCRERSVRRQRDHLLKSYGCERHKFAICIYLLHVLPMYGDKLISYTENCVTPGSWHQTIPN